ncbi:hypothetical protein Golax_019548, partial [Gossypium laxum]|nr:hypothetical protein [Gossypium laxum]
WVLEDSCEEDVKKLWETSSESLTKRLATLSTRLHDWATHIKEKRARITQDCTKRLNYLNNLDSDDKMFAELTDVKMHLNLDIKIEEAYWEQRAQANWLQIEDRNKIFFHNFAFQRQCTSQIRGLYRDDGDGFNKSVGAKWLSNALFLEKFGTSLAERAPESSYVKINFDVAFNKQGNRSCSGIVIRDLNSLVLGSKAVLNVNIPVMFAAEALTCVQMIQMGLDQCFTTMKVEGDALSVVKKLQTDVEDRPKNGERRTKNEVAHSLATEGVINEESTYLLNDVPPYVVAVVEMDRWWTDPPD